jgi:hypothetical protein
MMVIGVTTFPVQLTKGKKIGVVSLKENERKILYKGE